MPFFTFIAFGRRGAEKRNGAAAEKQRKSSKIRACSFSGAGGSDYRNTNAALQRTGRMEFGAGILGRIAEAFCDSPWISQEDYEQTLHEVTGLFYEFKNETMDIVSDDELIDFMKEAFDGFCKGSLELLAGRALPMLAEHVRSGEPLESFIYRAEQYEQS